MSSDAEFLRSLADEINGSELTQSWRRDRDWLREIATKLAAAEEDANWMWRAYRSGYLDGISNPEPYERLGYEKTVALAEAGATAYVAMLRIAAPRP